MIEINFINFLLTFFCLILLFINRENISNKLSIIDKPDNKRKFHKKNISALGGLHLAIVLFSFFIYLLKVNQLSNYTFVVGSFSLLLILIIGTIDDQSSINPSKKIFFFSLLILFLLLLNNNLVVTNIYFASIDKELLLFNFSIIFSILCYLLIINCLNLIDGENGIFLTYVIFLFFIFFFQNNLIFYFYLGLLLFILICNLNNFFFTGNSGTNLASLFFSMITILFYNNNYVMPLTSKNLNAEIIFLIYLIPGIDMLRVFSERSFKGKNPFSPDRSHLHYLMLKIFKSNFVFIPYTIISILPYFLTLIFDINLILLILLCVIFYSYFINYLKNK